MQNDVDGSQLPDLETFWNEWHKVLYTAIDNQLKALGRQTGWDTVQDLIVSEFALRYESYRENFHPGHSKPFSAYVVGATKQNVYRAIVMAKAQPAQLEETWEAGYTVAQYGELIPWDALDHDQVWVLRRVMRGHTLRELEELHDIPYSKLRSIMKSIRERVEGII